MKGKRTSNETITYVKWLAQRHLIFYLLSPDYSDYTNISKVLIPYLLGTDCADYAEKRKERIRVIRVICA